MKPPPKLGEEALSRYAHPAEFSHVTCGELHQLSRSVGRLRRTLTFLSQDMLRVTRYRKKLVYLLDFSELHAYLWPERSSSHHRPLIEYLLSVAPITFVLPPGAVLELIHNLSQQAAEHRQTRAKIADLFDKPFVQAFLNAYSAALDRTDDVPTLGSETTEEILRALQALRGADTGLTRLAKLYEDRRLVPLSSYVDATSLSPDPEILQEALAQLSSCRPTKEDVVNLVDAHNYSLAYALNNAFYAERNLFFLLVTSSPIPYTVFEAIKWKEDPHFGIHPENTLRTSLVRHVVDVLYHSHVQSLPVKTTAPIHTAIRDLDAIQRAWASRPTYDRYLTERDIPASSAVRLPQNRRYLRHFGRFTSFYRNIYRPVTELLALGTAQEQNRRLLLREDIYLPEGSDLLESFVEPTARPTRTGVDVRSVQRQPLATYRTILSLFDRLINITHAEIARASEGLARVGARAVADIDIRGLVVPLATLSVTRQNNDELHCIEFSVAITPKRNEPQTIFLSADRYDDYVSFWWRTTATFVEFMKCVRTFLRSIAEWQAQSSKAALVGEKQYSGAYFYLDDEVKHFPLEQIADLSADTLLRLCEPSWHIRFLRLALNAADLCYDFEPVKPFPQRAGLITASQCVSATTDFIQWTHQKYVRRRTLANAIESILPGPTERSRSHGTRRAAQETKR